MIGTPRLLLMGERFCGVQTAMVTLKRGQQIRMAARLGRLQMMDLMRKIPRCHRTAVGSYTTLIILKNMASGKFIRMELEQYNWFPDLHNFPNFLLMVSTSHTVGINNPC